MDHVMFLLFRAYFITLMTVGMMASLTEFRFGRRKLLGIMAVYSAWVVGSSLALLYFGGELLLLRLFLITISAPATFLTYWAANDTPSQAVFNYMTQILLALVVVANRKDNPMALQDASCAMENMMLAAQSLGLGSCWIHRAKEMYASEEGKAFLAELGVEGDVIGVGHCILGYPDGELPEAPARKEGRVFYVR